MSTRGRLLLASLLATALTPGSAHSQAPEGPYLDEAARSLHAAAVANRERRDESVVQYTAKVRQRMAVALRTLLKDRTLWRLESTHRVFWNRDGDDLVQALALREQKPLGGVEPTPNLDLFGQAFDPMGDPLLFGAVDRKDDLGDPDEDDFRFEHPLYREYGNGYRFSTGDTLTLSLPDGRRIQAIELQVVPVVASVHRMTGSLWIEPETGALVRAVYRLSDTFDAFRDVPELRDEGGDDVGFVPGLLKPWTADLSLIAVDYSLWDFDVWLPRSLRAEGVVAAGILKAPITVDVTYEIESVTTEADLDESRVDEGVREVHFRTRSEALAYLSGLAFDGAVPYTLERGGRERDGRRTRYFVPEDRTFLAESPELPVPVWEDAPGFTSEREIDGYLDGLADLPAAPLPQVPTTLRWGPQRPDLVRYNRVEALSLGVRGQVRPHTPVGPISLTGTFRLGIADRHPNVALALTRETLKRRVTLSLYHELTAIEERARHLEIGNSVLAATIGRDDGDYHRRTGGTLEWTPPTAGHRSFRVRGYVEHQRGVSAETDFSLLHAGSDTWSFRPNIAAEEGWEYGGSVELTPYWGSDPNLTQGGIDATLQAAVGDFQYARGALVGHLVLPLPARLRVAIEAGAGTSWGSPSIQRLWYVGGPFTLRGYDPRAGGGTSFGRARGELARGFSFGRLSLFSDLAWAGDRRDVRFDDALYSVGTGVSILDGLIRLDAAWGLRSPRGFRLEAYLDQLL